MSAAVGEAPETRERVVRGLFAAFKDARTGQPVKARGGERVQLTPEQEAHFDSTSQLVPFGLSDEDTFELLAHNTDTYRAERGDPDARVRVFERIEEGRLRNLREIPREIVDLSGSTATPQSVSSWLRAEKPTVEQVLARAETPEEAKVLLEGEELATRGNPRQGVVNGLTKIIENG